MRYIYKTTFAKIENKNGEPNDPILPNDTDNWELISVKIYEHRFMLVWTWKMDMPHSSRIKPEPTKQTTPRF